MYTHEYFSELLGLIRNNGYNFSPFADCLPEGSFLLRHDVDISVAEALELAKIEHNHGVRATYFFQLGADTYNMLSEPNMKTIRDIAALGHDIGLHLDYTLFSTENTINKILDVFQEILPIKRLVSFHRPAQHLFGTSFVDFISAYSEPFFIENYVSDSRGNAHFSDRLNTLLAAKLPLIQMLLHPVWWSSERTMQDILSRREREVREYVTQNFPGLFEGRDVV